MSSAAVEDYLKAIYQLGHEGTNPDPVPTSEIAARLGLTAATVTGMVQKLAQPELDLLHYTPYQGVRLTEQGEKMALRVIRRHRLLELYLAERLGLRWDQVHEEAERLEHVISPTLEERIAATLGDPQVDPHGHPIPSASGELAAQEGRALAALPPGEPAVIVSVADGDSELLRYFAARGMYPGVPLLVLEREPFGGPIHLRVGPAHDLHDHTVGLAAAEGVRVRVAQNTPVAVPADAPTLS